MGGGDLNLKKSWHPSTLRNIERVWKAEQKHETEQQKIEQLQKELEAERAREEMQSYAENTGVVRKRDQRLDWMYQGPAACVDREDYLMGRKIDKTLELLDGKDGKEADKREEDQARSIFHPDSNASDITVDLANKIKEDPLFAIMKREKEERKTLLNNPIRMKQLQSLLVKSLSKSKKSKKSKKKKSKKSRKEESSSSTDSSDDEIQEVKRTNKRDIEHNTNDYNYKRQKLQKNISRDIYVDKYNYHSKKEKYNSSSDESNHRVNKKHHKSHSSREKNYRNQHHSPDEQNYKKRQHSAPKEISRNHQTSDERSTRNHQSYKEKSYRNNHQSFDNKNYRNYNEHSTDRKESSRTNDTKRKLTTEEKERLRQEMLDNAKWRDKQRVRNVKRYEKETEKEEKPEKGSASDFIRPMLSKAAEYGTVEDRVRQKIFTIQRSKSDMNSNFARR